MIETHDPTRVAESLRDFPQRTNGVEPAELGQPALAYLVELGPHLSFELLDRVLVEGDAIYLARSKVPLPRCNIEVRSAEHGDRASCREKRSSCAAATRTPSRSRQAAESW